MILMTALIRGIKHDKPGVLMVLEPHLLRMTVCTGDVVFDLLLGKPIYEPATESSDALHGLMPAAGKMLSRAPNMSYCAQQTESRSQDVRLLSLANGLWTNFHRLVHLRTWHHRPKLLIQTRMDSCDAVGA